MKKIRISLMACLAILACASVLLMHSCKEDDKIFAGVTSSEVTIELGDSYQFNLQLVTSGDASADGITATWKSADDNIASVDGTGLVTANEVGSTVVTANLSNGQYVTAMVTVEKPSSMAFQLLEVVSGGTNITNIEEIYLAPQGGTQQVYMNIAANELSAADSLRLTIEDTDKAMFLQDGVAFADTVIALDVDTISFTIRPENEGVTRVSVSNGSLRTYLTVNVGPVVNLSWVDGSEMLSNSLRVYLQDGETKLTAYATVSPSEMWNREGLYDYEVTQNNPDNPAALIEDFDQSKENESSSIINLSWTIKPLALGTTKMTVTSRGETINLVLKVVDKERVAVNGVSITYNETPVAYASADSTFVGEVTVSREKPTVNFGGMTDPQNAAATWPITWASSDESILSVDSVEANGCTFTLNQDGEVYITASAGSDAEGSEHPRQTAKLKVIVKTDITAISLTAGQRSSLMVGEAIQYTYTTSPAGATPEGPIEWVSTDTSVAEFDADGVLHAHNAGQTSIYVQYGDLKSEALDVTVVEQIADYNYDGAEYYHNFSNGRLQIIAQALGDDKASDLYADLDVTTLTDGTYTIGQNMSNVTFRYDDLTCYVTSGSITVRTVDGEPEFDIDLAIELESGSINITGSLARENYSE